MTIANVGSLVQAVSGGGTTIDVAMTGLTSGNHIGMHVTFPDDVTISSASITGTGNTVSVHASTFATDTNLGYSTQICSVADISTGGDQTLTVTMSGVPTTNARAAAQEMSGGNTSAWFDAGAGANGTADDPSTSITTTVDGCHIFGHINQSGNGEATAGTNYTAYDLDNVGWWTTGQADTDFDAGTSGSKTFAWVTPASGNYVISVAAFAPAATGADISLSPAQADLTLSTTTPLVVNPGAYLYTPAQGDLVLSTTAPGVDNTEQNKIPAAADLALSTVASDLSVTSRTFLDVPAADLFLSTTAPTAGISSGSKVPASADLILSTVAPNLTLTGERSPASADLTLSTTAPTIVHQDDRILIPLGGNLILLTTAPSLGTVVESGAPSYGMHIGDGIIAAKGASIENIRLGYGGIIGKR